MQWGGVKIGVCPELRENEQAVIRGPQGLDPLTDKSEKYPNMTPIFSAIADRDEHRRLILAVVEAANPWAKAWATMGSSPTDSEEHALAQAVFALLHFEELQGK